MTDQRKPPIERIELVNGPDLVGARWWNDSLGPENDDLGRRSALRALLFLGAGGAFLATCAGVSWCARSSSASSDDDATPSPQDALDAQRENGWDFGAEGDPLVFDGLTTGSFDRSVLDTLGAVLSPLNPAWRPFYQSTLLQSLNATAPASSTSPKLRDVVQPIHTAAMAAAFDRGRAIASLFVGAPPATALIIDLPGPEAVAVAAALASRFDPVCLFDNWPHPRGVVPSHLVLGALAYYAETFARAKGERASGCGAAFVVDEARLNPYADSSDRFDNRYVAKLPSKESLRAAGVERVLLVRRGLLDQDLDDLNADVVDYEAGGIPVRVVALESFLPDDGDQGDGSDVLPGDAGAGSNAPSSLPPATGDRGTSYYYGGHRSTHFWFWSAYGLGTPSYRAIRPGVVYVSTPPFRPVPRPTLFGIHGTRPSGFGRMYVFRSTSSGRAVGVGSRSGSWSRSGSHGGG